MKELRFELKLQYRYGFVHTCYQNAVLLGQPVFAQHFWQELSTRVVSVCIHCKRRKMHQVYAIAFFESQHICIPQRDSYDITDASIVSGTRSHPQNIVVAPLYIPIFISAEGIHYDMRARTTVIHIAENVQLVDYQRCITVEMAIMKSSARPVEIMVSMMALT